MAETLAEFEAEQAGANPEVTPETIPAAEGQPAVKENMVIIDGKERPLKNYEAELQRKHNDELARIKAEYETRYSQPTQPVQPTAPQPDYWAQVDQAAEQEIAATGKAVPMKTIASVANSIAQRNMQAFFQTKEQSEKAIRGFKRSVRETPDWKDMEDSFDELVDQLEPHQVNAPTLEIILNSVRGKKGVDREKLAYERGKQDALKDTQILGAPEGGQPAGTAPKTTLTLAQKAELDEMNKDNTMGWTEEEYKKALIEKQNRFKASEARNVPVSLNDAMIK